jgi:CxxC motif-containing protein (DUF1111 family)
MTPTPMLPRQGAPLRQGSGRHVSRRAGVVFALVALFVMHALVLAQRATQPGDALPGIAPVEFDEFRLGLQDFLEVEEAEEGLGPAFNGRSCAECHSVPAIGGMSPISEVRAARRNARGEFEAYEATGETLFQLFSVPGHACQAVIPDDATIIARRIPIPVFGAGLVEAIPDETIRALEDPFDRNGDGVSGRAALVTDLATGERRVGRFGWKAQHATLVTFGADAYRNEMGITNDLFPLELALGVTADRMRLCDPIPEVEDKRDPSTRRRGIDNFASFMRFLAPPARGSGSDQVRLGEQIFAAIECTTCHVPNLTTGPSANPLFNRQNVPLFSDLLLHDIGTGDGIKQAAAEPEEIRTPTLWGLRLRRPFLHDGSAATIDEAIGRHRNEAERARRGVERLDDGQRAALAAFLRSL